MKALIFSLILGNLAQAMPSRIILIRHAEKPTVNSEHLSARGFQRAQALVNIFRRHPDLVKFGFPVAYVASAFVPGQSANRSIETLSPLANSQNIVLSTPYLPADYLSLVENIKGNPNLNHQVVMITWTHTYIYDLAKAFGAKPTGPWQGPVFDRIWVLDFLPTGSVLFQDLPQLLLPGDSTQLNLE
jgi:hypothetical protein